MPWGRETTPRTIWSDFFGSTPRRMLRSTEESNLVKVMSFSNAAASSRAYSFSGLYFARAAFLFFVSFAMFCRLLFPGRRSRYIYPHAPRSSGHHLHCRLYLEGVEVWHFGFGDGPHLIPGDGTDLGAVRFRRSLLLFGRIHDENRGRRCLDNKIKRLIVVDRDQNGEHLTLLVLRPGVELLTKVHDIQTLASQRRTDRGRRVGLSALDLQFQVTCNFF